MIGNTLTLMRSLDLKTVAIPILRWDGRKLMIMDCYGKYDPDNVLCQLCERIEDGECAMCKRDTQKVVNVAVG